MPTVVNILKNSISSDEFELVIFFIVFPKNAGIMIICWKEK